MKIRNLLLTSALLTAGLTSIAFASDDKNDDDRERYKEHYQQRHQMGMDMMRMLSETMTILRKLEHRPSESEKKKLGDMIAQLDDMIKQHKEMGDRHMERMNNMGRRHMEPRGMGGD